VNLREKLARLAGPAPPAIAACLGGEPAAARGPAPPQPERWPLEEEIVGPEGATFLVRRTSYPLSHARGALTLGDAARLDPGAIAALGDAEPLAGPPGAPLFFDTETTSLGSGAGVYVFLVGFAAHADERFIVEQLYLREVAGERAMLLAVAERIRAAPLLVSFSGRGFDERRLEDRYRFLALPSPFLRRAHADLCPLTRALWRSRLGSCALGTVERERLGIERGDDVPGAECPATYFRALRGDEAAREAVLRHNREDILSLAALAAALERRRAGARDAAEHLGFARHERRRRRFASALAALEAASAMAAALSREERRDLRLELAHLLRRLGRDDEGAAHLRALLAEPGDPPLDALLLLGKHAEHRARDLALAERCAVEAISLLRRGASDVKGERRAALLDDLTRRLARIAAKARRAGRSWFADTS
jgi:hypothetical protein